MKSCGFFSVIVVFSLLLISPWNAYGMHGISDLEETPFGFYQKICIPSQIGGGYKGEELPTSHSIMTHITPAKNQYPLGTCVSFAASACCEYYHNRLFSEAEFTILAQTDENVGNKCTGGLPHLGKALGVAKNFGFIEENRLQYESYLKQVAIKNGINIQLLNWEQELGRKEAKEGTSICRIGDYNGTMNEMGFPFRLYNTNKDITEYRLGNLYPIHHVSKISLTNSANYQSGVRYRFANTNEIGTPGNASTQEVKYQLAQDRPVTCALSVFSAKDKNGNTISSNWDLQNANYTIRYPSNMEISNDLHAVVLTGFDDSTELFTLKNSWGKTWGDKGFAYIPYNYVKQYSTELVAIGEP